MDGKKCHNIWFGFDKFVIRLGKGKGVFMKSNLHPVYEEISVHCSCGNAFQTKSVLKTKELRLDICSECHPFYTGQQKMVDTAGRIDKFNKRYSS